MATMQKNKCENSGSAGHAIDQRSRTRVSKLMFIKSPVVNKAVIVIAAIALNACVSTPSGIVGDTAEVKAAQQSSQPSDSVVELNQDQIKIETASELAKDITLPNQELTAETLAQLLTLNFASFNGQWPLASKNALEAAEATQDFRLARLATLFSLQTSDYEKASSASAIWLALKPGNVDAQNMNIIALVGASKIEQAKQSIDVQMQGQEIDKYIKQVAALLVRQTNQETGFDVMDYLVQKYPESAQVHVSGAYVAEVFKQYEAAEFWVNNALEIKPGWDLAAQMNVRLLLTQNKVEERSAFIKEFVEQYPSSVAMRISHASELVVNKKYAEAYDLMLEVLKDAPNDVSALQFSAALAKELNDAKKAAYYYRRALNIEPKNDDVRMAAAGLALSEKRYVTAERFYGDVSAPDKFFEAQVQLANVRYEIGGIDSAMLALAMIEPQTNDQYLQLAITRHYLLMRAFKYEEAFGYANDTLVYMPSNQDLLYARGLVAAELQKLSIAEQDLRSVISANPKNANALNALGYTLADQTDRLEEAKELIGQALLLRPNDAHILDSWGWVAYRLKDFDTAIEYLRKAYEVSPEVEVAAHLGEALWESGEQEEAKSVWAQAYAEQADNPVLNATLEKYAVTFSDAKRPSNNSFATKLQ